MAFIQFDGGKLNKCHELLTRKKYSKIPESCEFSYNDGWLWELRAVVKHITVHLVQRILSSRFSGNSDANASKLQENHEKMCGSWR